METFLGQALVPHPIGLEARVNRILALLLMMVVGSMALDTAAVAQSAAGEAGDLVATQVREQGYACTEPSTAKPDPSDSEVGERAWILTCADASYRVRLVPDMAATIEPID
jgi:hypothetical protein